MKVTFLFGSGLSVPAGVPTMKNITERILSGEGVVEKSVEPVLNSAPKTTLNLLRWLEIQVKRRYSDEPPRHVNYEDLYFLANQIDSDLTGDYDNPGIRPLIEKALAKALPRMSRDRTKRKESLKQQAAIVVQHIRECVKTWLAVKLRRPDYLDFIAEALTESGHLGLDILTLNHDTIVEQYLSHRRISWTNGFAHKPNAVGVREWRPEVFNDSRCEVRLLKLHGGIDWYRLGPKGAKPWVEEYRGVPMGSFGKSKDEAGRPHELLDQLPFFLIGTFNKLWNYTDTVYLELYHRAFRILEGTDVLVVVGYGFGDKGINKRITDWILRSGIRRLVVVDLYACDLCERARGAIAGKWHELLNERRLIPVPFDLNRRLPWVLVRRLLG